ncbi:MAG: cytochrome P450 [Novosphingobium sp.]
MATAPSIIPVNDPKNPVPFPLPRLAGPDHIPDHVPPELIRSVGIPFGPEFNKDPYAFFAAMQETLPPIYYDVGPIQNAWQLLKHEDAFFMLRHGEYFSSASSTPFPRDPNDYFYFLPIEIDPPTHHRYRAIVDPLVNPKAVLQWEERIRKLTNELIDAVIDKGGCEFTEQFARHLPVGVFLDLMGLPKDMMDQFVVWVVQLLKNMDPAKMVGVMKEIGDYLNTAIAEKRANPDGGMISQIVHAAPDGEPLTEKEIFGFVFFVFIAGIDTVYATLNSLWYWLARNPERRAEMIADPGNINAQVEELLRVYSTTFSGRILKQDLELRGVKMKAGDRVTSILPACNYDPEVFPNPREVDFHRPRKPILAFGGGVHSCMGAHLARLEIKIAIQEWLRRIPEFSVKPGVEVQYPPSAVVGPEPLPLVW